MAAATSMIHPVCRVIPAISGMDRKRSNPAGLLRGGVRMVATPAVVALHDCCGDGYGMQRLGNDQDARVASVGVVNVLALIFARFHVQEYGWMGMGCIRPLVRRSKLRRCYCCNRMDIFHLGL